MALGKILAWHLKEAGRNAYDVALEAGVKPSTLRSMIDRDGGTSTLNLVRVARVLGLTVEQLYEEAGMLEPAARSVSMAMAQQIDRLDEAGITAVQRTLLEQEARMTASAPEKSIELDSRRRRSNVPELPTNGFREASPDIVDAMRSDVFYLQALVPGLMEATAPGDILVVRASLPAGIGDTGLFQWDGTHYICKRQLDTLLVKGPHPWTRSITRPYESLGKVVGTLHL